jgi:hypothetical protein
MNNWQKYQTIIMACSLIGGAVACYVSVKSDLAMHGTKIDNIAVEIQRIDRSMTTLTDRLLTTKKLTSN